MPVTRCCWLVKTEPECFSIHHLAACPGQATCWDGVRNYQARNFMREMRLGDRVLFYHSSADPPAVAGTAVVAREAYPDQTAWDPGGMHYDPKASPDNPIWQMVDIRLEDIFRAPVPIGALRSAPELKSMVLLRQGSRLSVQPVTPREFEIVLEVAKAGHQNPTASRPARRKKRAAPTGRAAKKNPGARTRKRSPGKK